MTSIPLHRVVAASAELRKTRSRLDKQRIMATLFASLAPGDLRLAACWLSGEIPQGRLNVGWRSLEEASEPDDQGRLSLFDEGAPPANAADPPTLADVDSVFERLKRVSGKGAARRRADLVRELLDRLGDGEQRFLRRLIIGELRQGALRSLVVDALAATLDADAESLRRAIMFAGSFGDVVLALASQGPGALSAFSVRPLTFVQPMLAATADDVDGLFGDGSPLAAEWKVDGMRVQLHRSGEAVRAFSRQGRDVSAQLPELVRAGRAYASEGFVLDGEVTVLDSAGRPLPFQDLMSRVAREGELLPGVGGPAPGRATPLYFDVLFHDGRPLIDRPYAERRRLLESLVPPSDRLECFTVDSTAALKRVYAEALERGHEGVVVKDPASLYSAGRRGSHWSKLKPTVTLDLVILAAEWGHGRRRGVLSNIHLGARDDTGARRFYNLGKTFKGLTDEMLRGMTADLLALESRREPGVVFVRPERVVEIAFDSVQRSPRYDSGMALRFARVKRFRPDKTAAEATRLGEIRKLLSS